jgi:hypothetical protein
MAASPSAATGIRRNAAEYELITPTGTSLSADFVWHLDSYERIEGSWQAVWSQATKTSSA